MPSVFKLDITIPTSPFCVHVLGHWNFQHVQLNGMWKSGSFYFIFSLHSSLPLRLQVVAGAVSQWRVPWFSLGRRDLPQGTTSVVCRIKILNSQVFPFVLPYFIVFQVVNYDWWDKFLVEGTKFINTNTIYLSCFSLVVNFWTNLMPSSYVILTKMLNWQNWQYSDTFWDSVLILSCLEVAWLPFFVDFFFFSFRKTESFFFF